MSKSPEDVARDTLFVSYSTRSPGGLGFGNAWLEGVAAPRTSEEIRALEDRVRRQVSMDGHPDVDSVCVLNWISA